MSRHGSCVMRPVLSPSGVPSWLMRHASRIESVRRHASWLMAHASGVMRPTRPPSIQSQSFSHRRPLPVMTTTGGGNLSMLAPSDLRLLSCTAWGNRVVLSPSYSPTGANKNSGRRLIGAPPAVVTQRKKAGIMPALFMICLAVIR